MPRDGLSADGIDDAPYGDGLLEDPERLRVADAAGLLPAIAGAGAQVREMAALTAESEALRVAVGGAPRALLVAGYGAAASTADWLTALSGRRSPCPVLALPAGPLPTWVGPADLLVIADPGDSDGAPGESAVVADAAARRGTAMLGIGRAGGALHERCTWARAPFVVVPAGRVEGAESWSYLTPALLLAERSGLLDAADGSLGAELADALTAAAQACRPDADSVVNPAKSLALDLLPALPVMVTNSASGMLAARWLGDALGRVAGLPAVRGLLPRDLDRMAAYCGGPFAPSPQERDLFRDRTVQIGRAVRLVMIRDRGTESPAATLALRELLARAEHAGIGVSDLPGHGTLGDAPIDSGEGGTLLERLATRANVADFAAVYLALVQGAATH